MPYPSCKRADKRTSGEKRADREEPSHPIDQPLDPRNDTQQPGHADHVTQRSETPLARDMAEEVDEELVRSIKPIEPIEDQAERLVRSITPVKTPAAVVSDFLGEADEISLSAFGSSEGTVALRQDLAAARYGCMTNDEKTQALVQKDEELTRLRTALDDERKGYKGKIQAATEVDGGKRAKKVRWTTLDGDLKELCLVNGEFKVNGETAYSKDAIPTLSPEIARLFKKCRKRKGFHEFMIELPKDVQSEIGGVASTLVLSSGLTDKVAPQPEAQLVASVD